MKLSHVAVVVVSLLVFATVMVPVARAETSSQVSAQIGQAYAAVLNAEQNGGNVSSLVAQLNSAISLVQEADLVNSTNPSRAQTLYSQAFSLASQVVQSAPGVAAAGRTSVSAAQFDLIVESIVLAALAGLVYVYTPKIFWNFWLRTHRDWRVKKR
jgi:hypothetical protein